MQNSKCTNLPFMVREIKFCVKKNALIVIFLKLVYRLWNAHKGQQVLVSRLSCEQPNIGATIRISREIRCLPYAGFFLVDLFAL